MRSAQSFIASGVRNSSDVTTIPLFKSVVLTHMVEPPKYSCRVRDGVVPLEIGKSRPKVVHVQATGIVQRSMGFEVAAFGRTPDSEHAVR